MKDCGIVKDLLPLYAEDMASEESSAFVREHLETCEDCRKAFEQMKAPVETEPAAPLKTVRKAVKKRGWLIAGLIACLIAALLLGTFARLFKPIPLNAQDALAAAEVIPETIPLPAELPQKQEEPQAAAEPATPAPEKPFPTAMTESETVAYVVVMLDDKDMLTLIPASDGMLFVDTDSPIASIEYHLEANPADSRGDDVQINGFLTETPSDAGDRKTAYVYSATEEAESIVMDAEPEAVIVSTPKTIRLTAEKGVKLQFDRTGGELSVSAYTTLWNKWFARDEKLQETEIPLTGIDAVFCESYDNTDRSVLYARDGYAYENGFALPRLVMNYYFLMALAGTVVLAVAWLVLRLINKPKARRVFGVLLIIGVSGVLAFLFAGFPATTIAPVRELAFVFVIALLLIGAGLSARALLKKE